MYLSAIVATFHNLPITWKNKRRKKVKLAQQLRKSNELNRIFSTLIFVCYIKNIVNSKYKKNVIKKIGFN